MGAGGKQPDGADQQCRGDGGLGLIGPQAGAGDTGHRGQRQYPTEHALGHAATSAAGGDSRRCDVRGWGRFFTLDHLEIGMGATTDRAEDAEGVEFIHEEDGSITAVDLETNVASFGETKAEALAMLAEALALHHGEAGEPIEDETDILEDLGIDPDEISDEPEPLPDFMR